MGHRVERIAEEIKKEVVQMIQEELKDPRIGFVTVTDVEVSSDLRHAKVYVSILGSEEEKKNTLAALQNAQGFVRSELGKRIPLRYTPEITFKFDPSIEHGARIMELLEQIKRESREKEGSGTEQ